ncbi:unnamed protein product [Phytophthora fragariaefolia]|uniref:Unnamed protein product n=1 Tax=Phytophthora fragariaefolia TaxID=1490495 RepID=A0A9W6YNE7_9STRA|nr:unnamed protein product [Phytophthora fragariaefolia]
MKRRAETPLTPPSEHAFDGPSAFTDFIMARDRRMRLGSLDEPTHTAAPTRVPPQYQPPQPTRMPPPQMPPQRQVQPPPIAQQDVQPSNFGLKTPKPRDLDWSGFSKFSRKETYAGADFKLWGLLFLQRLGAAQQMSGGDWPEEFKILPLSGKRKDTALVYSKKMLPGWTAVTKLAQSAITTELAVTEEDVQDAAVVAEFQMAEVVVKGDEAMGLSAASENHASGEDHHQREHGCLDTGQRVQCAPRQRSSDAQQHSSLRPDAPRGERRYRSREQGRHNQGADDRRWHEVAVDLSDVYYANNLMDNINSYGRLERQGVFLERRDGRSYVIREAGQLKLFEVYRSNDVLTVDAIGEKSQGALVHVVNAAVQEAGTVLSSAGAETTLLELHQRLGHIAYDTAERMADAKASGIKLTDRARPNCLTCVQGKQSKNNQSKKDTGANVPIDKIGGVIGSDIKGPMGPKDRIGNRYLINVIDYSTNYVRVFLAKKQGASNKGIRAFLACKLEREDTELRRTGDACEKTEKQKERSTAMPTTGASLAQAHPDKTNTKSKKKLSKRIKLVNKNKKLAAGQDATGPKGVSTEEQPLPAEEDTETRMHTRFMGAKHVPVARVKGVPLKDPKNYRVAMKAPRAKNWEQAIRGEIAALERNDTWEVIKMPRNAKFLHSKWVFKLKTHADGSIERYKARLVARGDQQEYGVNYTYTFSAVLDLAWSRLILVIARKWGVPARHGNVPSAFVKADKETNIEILLRIPLGMEIREALLKLPGVKDESELALRLKNGLYGLKQSGILWNFMLHAILVSLGFTQCYTDSCIYVNVEDDATTLVGVYVDDLLVVFLGISFTYDDIAGWELDQAQVTGEIPARQGSAIAGAHRRRTRRKRRWRTTTSRRGRHTAATNCPNLPVAGGQLAVDRRVHQADIAFAVHRATRHSHAPCEGDWRLAKKIAKYLKGTKDTKLVMCSSKASLDKDRVFVEAYSDADYAADKGDRKSVIGGVVMVAGIVVGWPCKKQSCVALSTIEAAFVAASQTTAGVLGNVELLQEIDIIPFAPSVLYVDNQAAIAQIEGEVTSGRAKHIDEGTSYKGFSQEGSAQTRVVRIQGNAGGHPHQCPPCAPAQ